MTTSNGEWLNLNQPTAELNEVHATDYYWYLRCSAFVESFLKPLAGLVNWYQGACLDVGCGEGLLGDLIRSDLGYLGLDGSEIAIGKARQRNPHRPYAVARLEDPQGHMLLEQKYGTVVFGGIMSVLIKPDCRSKLVSYYRERFGARQILIYDLSELDVSTFLPEYQPTLVHTAVADVDVSPEVKRKRSIWQIQF